MKKIFFLTALVLASGINAKVFCLDVPLTVTDYAGIERISEPVTSGIPLPESADIKNPYSLRIFDSGGSPVPAQFTVLARWAGKPDDLSKPIKWVLFYFFSKRPPPVIVPNMLYCSEPSGEPRVIW